MNTCAECGCEIRTRNICGRCNLRKWRAANPGRARELNRRHWQQYEPAPENVLETLCEAFNLEPLEIGRYILELRQRKDPPPLWLRAHRPTRFRTA